MAGEKQQGVNVYYISGVVAAYWVISISLVYCNKVAMSGDFLAQHGIPVTPIPAPLFVTWFQCFMTCVICYVLGLVGEGYRSRGEASFFTQFPLASYDFSAAMRVAPLSIIFVCMITFNNLCLKYVEVSFYNVARSLTICFNVVFTYVLLQKSTSLLTIATLAIVILGFVVGVDGEVNFSFLGTVSGVLSSVFVSLNSIFTKRVLPVVSDDKSKLLFMNNANAVALFLPCVLIFESSIIMENFETLFSPAYWMLLALTGVFGFMIGLVTVLQVKATSPLTHNISGTAKAALQSVLAFYIWGNEATFKGMFGIFLVLFGSGLYTYVQLKESGALSRPQGNQGGRGGSVNN